MLSAFIIVLNCVKNRWESMGDLSIRCGIFQVDNLLPLLFVLWIVSLTLILRKTKACYEWDNKEFKINHLLFMDDLKTFW